MNRLTDLLTINFYSPFTVFYVFDTVHCVRRHPRPVYSDTEFLPSACRLTVLT